MNSLAQKRLHAFFQHQIDVSPHDAGKELLDLAEDKIIDGFVELYEQIDIAVGSRLAARGRAEQGQGPDVEVLELRSVSGDSFRFRDSRPTPQEVGRSDAYPVKAALRQPSGLYAG